MAKDKEIGIPKELKAFGVQGAVQRGNQIELMIDPKNLSKDKRMKLGSGLTRAAAASLSNDPYLPLSYEGPYTVDNMPVHEKIKLAMRIFRSDPLVGRIIEMMKVLSNDGFKNEHSNPKIKKFYDNWCQSVNLELIFDWIFLEYYRSGNVTTWRELVPFKKSAFRFAAPPYSVDGSLSAAMAAKKNMFTKQMIPGAYTVLNPLTVHVDKLNGYNDLLYFDTKDTTVDPTSMADVNKLLLTKVPQDMARKFGRASGIPLNQKNVRRILRMRQPYEAYGSVMMERAFAAVHEKNKLRQMDMSMVNSVINQIIKVTIGNDEFPATPRQLKNLAEAFRNVGKSQVIFWNHTLEIEVIRPDTKVLNAEKYQRVDEDIRNAFGIAEVLLGGGGSKTNFATSYLSLKAFLTNLQQGRKDVLRWLRDEYEDIAEAMGFDSIPEVSFNELSLTDEIAESQIVMQLVDRGIISYTSAQSLLGFDPRIELERRTEEKPSRDAGLLGPVAPPFQEMDETAKRVAKEDKKKPDSRDQKVSQLNRSKNLAKDPSKNITIPGPPNKGAYGRPQTPNGKKMPGRTKSPKIKGQSSEEQISFIEEVKLDPAGEAQLVLSIASEFEKK